MYTINAIAKQANVGFDTVRNIIKRNGLQPAQAYNNGTNNGLLYTADTLHEVVSEAAAMHAKRAANKMKKLKKLTGAAVAVAQDNNDVLRALSDLSVRLFTIEQTLQRIEAGLPRFDMEAV